MYFYYKTSIYKKVCFPKGYFASPRSLIFVAVTLMSPTKSDQLKGIILAQHRIFLRLLIALCSVLNVIAHSQPNSFPNRLGLDFDAGSRNPDIQVIV